MKDKIIAKQDEIIVCYKNIMAGWLECISDLDRLESELSSLKAMEGEEVSDENDFVQYVTNLLYMAHGFGEASEGVNTPVFDEWVEQEMVNMGEFYASHNLIANKEIENMEGAINSIRQITEDVEELNMANYTEYQVGTLNDAMIEIYTIVHQFKAHRDNQ